MGPTLPKFRGENTDFMYLQTALENKEIRGEIKVILNSNADLRTKVVELWGGYEVDYVLDSEDPMALLSGELDAKSLDELGAFFKSNFGS